MIGDDLSISVISGNTNRQIRNPTHVFVHPEYNLNTRDKDIAILRVNVSYSASPTFNPVPRAQDPPTADIQCSVAGWGRISDVIRAK